MCEAVLFIVVIPSPKLWEKVKSKHELTKDTVKSGNGKKTLMCGVKRVFNFQESARKMKHKSCSRAEFRARSRLPALENGTRLEGGTGVLSQAASSPCALWARLQCFV